MNPFAKYLIAGFLLLSGSNALFAQQTDPLLIGAIYEQTQQLKKVYEKRNETQNKIIAAQALVSSSMAVVHEVERTVLNYMQNASGAVQNLHQLKRIVELTTIIPKNLLELKNYVAKNPQGAAMTALVSKNYADIITEVTTLSGHVSTLVTGSQYSFKDNKNDESATKRNINLLNSAERYYIAQEVVDRLENINHKIRLLRFRVQIMSWDNFFYQLDRETWVNLNYSKSIANSLIEDWNSVIKK